MQNFKDIEQAEYIAPVQIPDAAVEDALAKWYGERGFGGAQCKTLMRDAITAALPHLAPKGDIDGAMTAIRTISSKPAKHQTCGKAQTEHFLISQTANLFGPYGYINGHRALSEDSWAIEPDPDNNDEEYFSIPLYSTVDPFGNYGHIYKSHASTGRPVAAY